MLQISKKDFTYFPEILKCIMLEGFYVTNVTAANFNPYMM